MSDEPEEEAAFSEYNPDFYPCQQCGGESRQLHECPIARELGGHKDDCNCCEGCTQRCGMDI